MGWNKWNQKALLECYYWYMRGNDQKATFVGKLGVAIIMHDYLIQGFTTNTSMAHYWWDNEILLHIHHAMHVIIDKQKNHGMHFHVLAKALHMSGGDQIHFSTTIEGENDIL